MKNFTFPFKNKIKKIQPEGWISYYCISVGVSEGAKTIVLSVRGVFTV